MMLLRNQNILMGWTKELELSPCLTIIVVILDSRVKLIITLAKTFPNPGDKYFRQPLPLGLGWNTIVHKAQVTKFEHFHVVALERESIFISLDLRIFYTGQIELTFFAEQEKSGYQCPSFLIR